MLYLLISALAPAVERSLSTLWIPVCRPAPADFLDPVPDLNILVGVLLVVMAYSGGLLWRFLA